jgi:hypothetical protein
VGIGAGIARSSRTGRRRGVERRLRRLRNLEWGNIALLGVVLLVYVPLRLGERVPIETWLRSVTYLPVAALLAVGGWYWHRKLRRLQGDHRAVTTALPLLAQAGRAAVILLTAESVLLALAWPVGASTVADRVWATGFVVFGWLEYVNYFHWQLMYDTRADVRRFVHRGVRRSALRRDLDQRSAPSSDLAVRRRTDRRIARGGQP